MMRKSLCLSILILMGAAPPVRADLIMPLIEPTDPIIPITCIAEILLFWLLARWSKIQVKFWTLLGAVVVANIVTAILGTFYLTNRMISSIGALVVCFVLTALIEWTIYIQFFGKIATISKLLAISLLINLFLYGFVIIESGIYGLQPVRTGGELDILLDISSLRYVSWL